MDKRTVAILILVIGIAGCFAAGYRFMNGSGSMQNLLEVLIYSIIGSFMFFWGIDYFSRVAQEQHNPSPSYLDQESKG